MVQSRIHTRVDRFAALAFACLAMSACQTQPAGNKIPQRASVLPTVAGRASPNYSSAVDARDAYTRQSENGSLVAILEDAAWLRYEGTPEQVESKHKSYFKDGYTTFQVVMNPDEFTQPNKEVFILEDSSGRRFRGNPVTYKSAMEWHDRKYRFEFQLSFQHAVSADTRWIKLTREADGSTVRWDFNDRHVAKKT